MAYTAKWITPLAKAAKRSTAGIYYIFGKEGYKSPYTSELKGLTILRARGFPCSGYVPTEDAQGQPMPPLGGKAKGTHGITANGKSNSAIPAKFNEDGSDDKKSRGKWADQLLVSRLAKLLPGGPSPRNKSRIRWILAKKGFKKFKKLDEGIALAAIQEAGISIEGFEYANAPSAGVPSVRPNGNGIDAPATTVAALRTQYLELAERYKAMVEEANERDQKYDALRKRMAAVRTGLLSFETKILPIALTKFGGLVPPLNYPIDVLNLIREETKQQE